MIGPHKIQGSLDFLERFYGKIAFGEKNDCWEWQAYCNNDGYGRVVCRRGRNGVFAHRMMLEATVGERVPDGMVVMHTCDNRKCCNPAHLVIALQSDNAKDMHQKRRNWSANATQCFKGHDLTVMSDGSKRCLTCRANATSRYVTQNREKVQAVQRESKRRWREQHREVDRARAREQYWKRKNLNAVSA